MNGNKVIWWMLSIVGGIIVALGTAINAHLKALDIRMVSTEIRVAEMYEKVKQLDGLTTATRLEQIERTRRFGDLDNKLGLLDQRVRFIVEKFKVEPKDIFP